MKEEDFKKGIAEIKKIGLTKAEKDLMLAKILASVPSPYVSVGYFVRQRKVLVTVGTICLIFVLSAGGLVYASTATLPSDILYPIKTKVVEPVLDVVNSAPESKASWQEEKVLRRISEAEALAAQNKLDDEKTAELARAVQVSTAAFNEAVQEVASTTPAVPEKSDQPDNTNKVESRSEVLKNSFKNRVNPPVAEEATTTPAVITHALAPKITPIATTTPRPNLSRDTGTHPTTTKPSDFRPSITATTTHSVGQNKTHATSSPVSEDQKQHVQVLRKVALDTFNHVMTATSTATSISHTNKSKEDRSRRKE